MSRKHVVLLIWVLAGAPGVATLGTVWADSQPRAEFGRKASWSAPTPEAVREQAEAWVATQQFDEQARQQIAAVWMSQAEQPGGMLELVGALLAAADPRAQVLVARCSAPRSAIPLPDVNWLADAKVAPFERVNLRLLYGRWLIHEALYDEAGEQLLGLRTEDVVDPASLLFYQAVVCQRTLKRDEGLSAIARLLENEAATPKRFASLARLMQADLEPLKDESLDHIARRMDDIRRRLDLGRAGPKVREVEDGVIASLDKLIKKMEDEQQAAAAAAAAAGGGKQSAPSAPLPDSMPIEQKGPGEVAKKPVGDSSGWGQLPPKQRQEALQQIGKDYPAHYRDMIEQYFRKLASEGGETAEK